MFESGIALNGIDPTFDYIVSLLAPKNVRYTASQYESFEAMRDDYNARGVLTVNVNFSDNTIFGVPATNWAFRAWHDVCHIAENADFSSKGEARAAQLQIAQVWSLVGPSDADKARWSAIIDTEVNGQLEYFKLFGTFPDDQRSFAAGYLELVHGFDVRTFPRDARAVTVVY